LRDHCRRAFDVSTDVQPIEAKEEIHHWEKHTEEFRVWVKKSIPNSVLCESSDPLRKRSSNVDIATGSFAHLHMALAIEIIVLLAYSRVISMIGGQEIG